MKACDGVKSGQPASLSATRASLCRARGRSLCALGRARARPMNVHLIPHSHTDPGWLATYDTYYSRDVKPILNNVVASLEQNPNRTFTWAETCFFARWDAEQSRR